MSQLADYLTAHGLDCLASSVTMRMFFLHSVNFSVSNFSF